MDMQTHDDREHEQRLIASARRFDEWLLSELDDEPLDLNDFPLDAQRRLRELTMY